MKKKLILLFVLLSIIVIPVYAENTLISGNNNLIAGNDLAVDNKVESSIFTAGNNVDMSSYIDGANFVAGNNIALSSEQDILFVAGNSINLNGITTKDAFLAGSLINIQQSNIRDLYAMADTIRIDSDISRNAYLGGNSITINSRIDGDVELAAENIRIGKEAEITGTLKYPEESNISIAETAIVNKTKTYKSDNIKTENFAFSAVANVVYTFLAMLLIGFILIGLNRKTFAKIEKIKKDTTTILKEIGVGFAAIVVIPVASVGAICTLIGIPLSFIVLILYAILIYISSIPTAYYIGNLLKKQIPNKFLAFAIVLFCLYIIRLIPFIGGLVTFITICFGMGIYMNLIKLRIKDK